ncbi:MAG: HlyD family type I secretion periplasmic adaptor subunit [Pseudomonadota bacterium]
MLLSIFRRADAPQDGFASDLEASARARRTVAVGCGCFATLVAIAATFDISEIAFADGQMIPPANALTVEHLEGGRLSQLLVEPGDEVQSGTVLARLDPLHAETDLGVLESRQVALALERERLRALIHDTKPEFDRLMASPDALAEQRALLAAERSAIASMETAIAAQIAEVEAQIATAKRQVAAGRARVEVAARRHEMRENVFARGHNSEDQVLEAQGLLEIARTELSEAEREVAVARHRRASAMSELDRERADAMRGWIARRTEVSQELATLSQQIVLGRARVDEVTVLAPVHGVVQEILPSGQGAILRPGDPLLTIVPVGAVALAEVQLPPRDIGHVREGDRAMIAVDSFDERHFGQLEGRVESISATTFETPEGEAYYRLRLALDTTAEELRPGMTVQARISTGAKSLLTYFLDPVLQPLSRAFSER